MIRNTIVYIDGFNLYHAIDDLNKPHLKWVDLWSLSESLLRKNESLVEVNYFSAYATWRPAEYARHRKYVAALKVKGVEVTLGHFKIKDQKCFKCGSTWKSREEKETDVNMAVRVVADGLNERYDRAILITADSDLKPAVSVIDMPRKGAPVIELDFGGHCRPVAAAGA